jgi:hypothetical protein
MKQHDASLILSKLKQKLVDGNCHPLQKESIALYQHIEKTLLSALREHYRSKKTPRVIDTILANLREGLTKDVACSQAGITRNTLHRWCNDDEQLALEVQAAIGSSSNRCLTSCID